MDRQVRLTIGPAALAVVFGAIVVAVVAQGVLVAGRRPLGWALAAAVAAAAVEPLVGRASRYMRRSVALAVVLVPLLALAGLVTWGVVRDLDVQIELLQKAIPEVAAEIEAGEGMGDAATEFGLVEKAEELSASLSRPSSQVGEEAIGGAATWMITLILTLFALGWGPRFADAALRQVDEGPRRDRLARVVRQAFERSQLHIEASVVVALAVGIVAWAVFELIDLPAPTPLALVVGVSSLVPGIGVVLAVIPAALLAGGLQEPRVGVAVLLGGFVLQAAHGLVMRRATRGATHPGAAVIVISFIVGYEVYGVGGSVVGSCVAVFAAAVLDALREDDEADAPILKNPTTEVP